MMAAIPYGGWYQSTTADPYVVYCGSDTMTVTSSGPSTIAYHQPRTVFSVHSPPLVLELAAEDLSQLVRDFDKESAYKEEEQSDELEPPAVVKPCDTPVEKPLPGRPEMQWAGPLILARPPPVPAMLAALEDSGTTPTDPCGGHFVDLKV